MRVKLSIHNLADQSDERVFDRFPVLIGRSPDADITLQDRWVSRRHCEIHAGDGVLLVRDLGSKHGTLLNDAHITEGTMRPGDTLNVGLSTLVASFEQAVTSAREVESLT